MNRPLAITVLGWLVLATVICLGATSVWDLVRIDGRQFFYPIYGMVEGAFITGLVVGVLLLMLPRSGVVALHTFWGGQFLGMILGRFHMAAGFQTWPHDQFNQTVLEYLAGLPWGGLIVWIVLAAITIPLWPKTPWSSSFAGIGRA